MDEFTRRYEGQITGILSGWDRIRFRGSLRMLGHVGGMMTYLGQAGVLLKDFGSFVEHKSALMKAAIEQHVASLERPMQYIPSSATCKEEIALEVARRDGITSGLVCLLSAVEPCMSYVIGKDPERKRLVLKAAVRKCLHWYGYLIDETFGWMSVRIQSWFPFTIQICINGREWLARRMDEAGLAYERRDNCFTRLSDPAAAQKLMASLDALDWPKELERVCRRINPEIDALTEEWPMLRYWSAQETEWATDVMFETPEALAAIYPALVRGSIVVHGARDVMRFLGGRVPTATFTGDVTSKYQRRVEGVRVKHWVKQNSIKVYDKQGSVLRAETTVNDPSDFKAFRPKESGLEEDKAWRRVRRGVADLHRRGAVSQAANHRFLDALAAFDTSENLGDLVSPVSKAVPFKGRNVRGLNPWREDDQALLRVISQGQFNLSGFRNKDLVPYLGRKKEAPDKTSRRITNLLRILRAHRLIRKVPKTNRYTVTPLGHKIAASILQAQIMTLHQLANPAA